MEEFSEARIYKIKPELRNSDVTAGYFYSSGEYSNQLPDAEFIYDKTQINRHASANASEYLCFQLRLLDVISLPA